MNACFYEDKSTKQFNHIEMVAELVNQQALMHEKNQIVSEILEGFKADYNWDVKWNFQSQETCKSNKILETKGASSGFKAIIDLIFILIESYERLRKTICGVEVCAAIPEHWQIPLEAHRPQLVLQFAKPKEDEPELQSANHVISIPHYNGTIHDPAPVTFYDKGNYRGKLTLQDNSKVHVYGNSQSECFRMIKAIRLWINPAMLEGATEQYDQFPSADSRKCPRLSEIRQILVPRSENRQPGLDRSLRLQSRIIVGT